MTVDANLATPVGVARTIDLVGALRRQWFVPVLCGLVAALCAFGYTRVEKVTYESTSTVLLLQMHNETAPGGGRDRTLDMETQATLARSTTLMAIVGDRLQLRADEVSSKTTAVAAATGDVLILTFEDAATTVAAQGATVYSEEFLTLRRSLSEVNVDAQRRSLQAQEAALTTEIATLTDRIEQERSLGDLGSATKLEVLQQSQTLAIEKLAGVQGTLASIETDETPGRVLVDPYTNVKQSGLPNKQLIAGALVAGFFIGLVLALVRDRQDDRYGSVLDPKSLGIDEVGRVRFVPDAGSSTYQTDHSTRQSYSRLLMRICFSPDESAGLGTSTCILAVESRTLPHSASWKVAAALQEEGAPNAVALTVSAVNPLTASQADGGRSFWDGLPSAVKDLARHNDIVLIPAPPLDSLATGMALAGASSRTLLLVSVRTKLAEIRDALDDIYSVGQRDVEVVVLTRVPRRSRRAAGGGR